MSGLAASGGCMCGNVAASGGASVMCIKSDAERVCEMEASSGLVMARCLGWHVTGD